jgi:CheY-like chemotaxis protein
VSCLGLQGVELQLCRAAEAAEQAAAAATALREQRDAVGTFATLVDALATLALPLLLLFILWRMWPVLRGIFETRKFTIKLAGFELSAQEATDQLRAQVEDLQVKVAALSTAPKSLDADGFKDILTRDVKTAPPASPGGEGGAAPGPPEAARTQDPFAPVPPMAPARRASPRILWVDDQPENNAVLIAGFRDAGVEVTTARSTASAMALLGDLPDRFSAVISDQGRVEDGTYRAEAGTDLLRQMDAAGMRVPAAIFTTARGVRKGQGAIEAGAEMVTDSGTELRRFVDLHAGGLRAD